MIWAQVDSRLHYLLENTGRSSELSSLTWFWVVFIVLAISFPARIQSQHVPSGQISDSSTNSAAAKVAFGPEPTLRVIVVTSRAQAEALRDQLAHGADFALLAKANSIDPTARDGGYLGKIGLATLRPELQSAADKLVPGQPTAVIETSSGYVILQSIPEATTERPITNYTGPTRLPQQAALSTRLMSAE